MVRIDRFTIEYELIGHTIQSGSYEQVSEWAYSIFDRLKREYIVRFKTGDEKLDKELAEQVLTMLNIKFIGE